MMIRHLLAAWFTLSLVPSAFAVECAKPDSVPVMMIAVTPDSVSLSGSSIQTRNLDDGHLVCAHYDPVTKNVESVEFVNLVKDKVEIVPFDKLVTRGHENKKYIDFLGKTLVVARVKCPDCRPNDTTLGLQISVLHAFKLLGDSEWKRFAIQVGLQSRESPKVDYRGLPFHVVTMKTKMSVNGGVKQMRFSECTSEARSCLTSSVVPVKHLRIVNF